MVAFPANTRTWIHQSVGYCVSRNGSRFGWHLAHELQFKYRSNKQHRLSSADKLFSGITISFGPRYASKRRFRSVSNPVPASNVAVFAAYQQYGCQRCTSTGYIIYLKLFISHMLDSSGLYRSYNTNIWCNFI